MQLTLALSQVILEPDGIFKYLSWEESEIKLILLPHKHVMSLFRF